LEHSYHKPRRQSPRSSAGAEASAKKAPRIVPAILPERMDVANVAVRLEGISEPGGIFNYMIQNG